MGLGIRAYARRWGVHHRAIQHAIETGLIVRQPDGSYRISGTKIFISAGEHDLAENIVHLVLARIEGAPAGVKGVSLFVVPKILPNGDGSLGARNGEGPLGPVFLLDHESFDVLGLWEVDRGLQYT